MSTTTRTATRELELRVNGTVHRVAVEPDVTLLDALRERLGLTGTKKGCGHGQCGACTVLVGGRLTLACLTLAVMHPEVEITTVEGLSREGEPSPMQRAFVAHDAMQCGFCTPGQVVAATALVAERRTLTREEIAEAMSGHLCRCGAYPNIVDAIAEVANAEGR